MLMTLIPFLSITDGIGLIAHGLIIHHPIKSGDLYTGNEESDLYVSL